mmetsp:Transcript_3965/g.11631  ORF Transcript_3965/g.11631 Transcript_3965/m.11631 type:complete len:446 (-) Transcript_3965:182-1519(-)
MLDESSRLIGPGGPVGGTGAIGGTTGGGSIGGVARRRLDPVERSVWLAVGWLRLAWALWLFGIFLVIVKAADLPHFLSWDKVFVPFWLGNGAVAVLQVRLLLRAIGCMEKGKILSAEEFGRLSRSRRASELAMLEDSITEDSAHLVFRGVAGVILSIFILVLVTLAQAMLCLHLMNEQPGLWTCASPVILVQIGGLIQYALIKSSSWRDGAFHGLILLGVLSITHRATAGSEAGMSWAVALVPVWALNLVFLHLVLKVIFKHAMGRYHLQVEQLLCCVLYLLGILLTVSAVAMLAFKDQLPQASTKDPVLWLWLPLGTLFFGIACGGLGVFIVIGIHASWLLATKGFGEPLPLSRTEEGWWQPSGQEKSYELCFGILDKRPLRPQPRTMIEFRTMANNSAKRYGHRSFDPLPGSHSDQYDSGCDSAAFNDLYGGASTGNSESDAN